MNKRPFSIQHIYALIGVICFLCLSLLIGGYGKARKISKEGEKEYYVAEFPELVQRGDSCALLQWCITSIGESEDCFVSLWGNGKCTDENNEIKLRRYPLVLFEQKVDVITSVEHGRISAITISPEKGDYTIWFQILQNSFGTPQESIQKKVGRSDMLCASAWNIGEGSLDLRTVYDGVELTLQQ